MRLLLQAVLALMMCAQHALGQGPLFGLVSVAGWLEYYTEIYEIDEITGRSKEIYWKYWNSKTNGCFAADTNRHLLYFTGSPQRGGGTELYGYSLGKGRIETTAWIKEEEGLLWDMLYQNATNRLFAFFIRPDGFVMSVIDPEVNPCW